MEYATAARDAAAKAGKVASNDTKIASLSPEACVHHLFEIQARSTPEACAVSSGDQRFTYRELNAYANRLAHRLIANGVGPGHSVAVMMDRSIACIAGLLGVLKTGGAYVPIDLGLPKARIEYILADSGAICLLVDGVATSRLQGASLTSPMIDAGDASIAESPDHDPAVAVQGENDAYSIYTSGSTGRPKGVMIQHRALSNYASWACRRYVTEDVETFAFYSSISFDLTVTSIFVPLLCGREVVAYPEIDDAAPIVVRVITDNRCDVVKLTPAHLAVIKECDVSASRIKAIILGGEDLPTAYAADIHRRLDGRARIYNEYGPTEATVGCMIHLFDPEVDTQGSVPIGKAIDNMRIRLIDEERNPVADGAIGQICIEGVGLALGYRNQPALTDEVFFASPFTPGARCYASGDLARTNERGELVFLGRMDDQIKLRGYRIELGEIENVVLSLPGVRRCTVISTRTNRIGDGTEERFCTRCGISSSYPNTTLGQNGECNHCEAFARYRPVIDAFFSTEEELDGIIAAMKSLGHPRYDCIVAFSGGKDSTYALCRLVDMGVRVLAFTLDNGYISEDAKQNIDRVVSKLGIDHEYLSTQYMNEIFVDSLRRYSNVCNGCFKTIYTLAVNLARKVGVDHIVTGLSRGQLLETRLGELLRSPRFDGEAFERNVVEARKIYHRVDDVAGRRLDTSCVRDDSVMEKTRFVDFYRYCSVGREAMYEYIRRRVGWSRPIDTGRSTNCLINDVGIYVHNRERRFHNYSLPYSWDVRLGHIEREAALRELDDSTDIDVDRVQRIMNDIGYELNDRVVEFTEAQLIAYYVGEADLDLEATRARLAAVLPDYMIPSAFMRIDQIPLTPNGKVNRRALPKPEPKKASASEGDAPRDEIETQLVELWKDALKIDAVGIHDDFFALGGHSLPALMLLYRIDGQFGATIGIQQFSMAPTIEALAKQIRSRG